MGGGEVHFVISLFIISLHLTDKKQIDELIFTFRS